MSNIWESMQRGLEKASQEAARFGRIQRLRSTIDSLSRQLNTQNNLLVTRAMEVFAAGQMTQSELRPICQDLEILRQQLDQAQHELKALMNQGMVPPHQTGQTPSGSYPPVGDLPPTMPVPPVPAAPPPPGYPTIDSTVPIPAPPPPPGVQPATISALDTLLVNTGNPASSPSEGQTSRCPRCQAQLVPGYAYCHNCGSHLEGNEMQHQPTMRSGFSTPGQETIRSEATAPIEEPSANRSTGAPPPPPHIADQATERGELSSQETDSAEEKDGGQ
jgi:hypothetical protein